MPRAAFVYDDAMSQHVLRQDHPMRPIAAKYLRVAGRLRAPLTASTRWLVTPALADETSVGAFHSRDYMAAVRTFSLGLTGSQPERFGFAQGGDNPTYPGMYEAAMLSTGATSTAARMVADGEVPAAFNISGGLHHAAAPQRQRLLRVQRPGGRPHVPAAARPESGLWDIDAHHGDGVQNAFYNDPHVLTISVHESGQYLFPGTGFAGETGTGDGVGYRVNLPLYPYTDDEIYMEAFEAVVPPLLQAFAPDVLLTQLGIDSYHTDPADPPAGHQPGVHRRRGAAGRTRLSLAGHRRRGDTTSARWPAAGPWPTASCAGRLARSHTDAGHRTAGPHHAARHRDTRHPGSHSGRRPGPGVRERGGHQKRGVPGSRPGGVALPARRHAAHRRGDEAAVGHHAVGRAARCAATRSSRAAGSQRSPPRAKRPSAFNASTSSCTCRTGGRKDSRMPPVISALAAASTARQGSGRSRITRSTSVSAMPSKMSPTVTSWREVSGITERTLDRALFTTASLIS